MSKTLTEIAQQLIGTNKKVQLIYAFNSSGKTRLSRAFKQQISPKDKNGDSDDAPIKILYYNAFTEDLFYWDNDLKGDAERKLKIQPNAFTKWVLKDQGHDKNIITNFQRYANEKLTPRFNEEYLRDENDPKSKVEAFSEVTFSLETGDNERKDNLKISKGEESKFIWSIFYTLLYQVISILKVAEPSDRETDQFDQLEYVFIDDPVSSLDENHLIELAVNLAELINLSEFYNGQGVRFIISTHNPLFYNVLYNEVSAKSGCILRRFDDGTFELEEKKGDSNRSFSFHLYLKQILEQAIAENQIEKYHFTLLRNLYEKTASFLGYPQWSALLPDVDKQNYLKRIIQFTSHSTLSNEAVAEPTEVEKKIVTYLLNRLTADYNFWPKKAEENA